MTIRISEDTIVLVAVVIGIFLLAMMCLACSLNPREILDGSLFRCCQCCHRRRTSSQNHHLSSGNEDHHTYETLNEFIFEADDTTNSNNNNRAPKQGFVAMSSMPTTMEQVFPDLLGSSGDESSPSSPHPSQRQPQPHDLESRPIFRSSSEGANVELSEPLL